MEHYSHCRIRQVNAYLKDCTTSMDNGLPIIIANGSLWQIVQSLSTFGAVILAILVSMSLASWMSSSASSAS